MITLEVIRRLAQEFPGLEESTSYGTPAMKVGNKLVLRLHQSEDAIVVLLDSVDDQQSLITQDPANFYIIDHYRGHAAVLVRPTVDEPVFRTLLESAWRRVARKREIAQYREVRSACDS